MTIINTLTLQAGKEPLLSGCTEGSIAKCIQDALIKASKYLFEEGQAQEKLIRPGAILVFLQVRSGSLTGLVSMACMRVSGVKHPRRTSTSDMSTYLTKFAPAGA